MKKILLLFVIALGMAMQAGALTYEAAFETVKKIPQMKGVSGTEVSGHNDFKAIGVTDSEMLEWRGERGLQTKVYGDVIYKLIGDLPASEMVQCRMTDSDIFAVFAKPVSEHSSRIIIFSDSAYEGFTGAVIGYISNEALSALRSAILVPGQHGGTSVYLKALSF